MRGIPGGERPRQLQSLAIEQRQAASEPIGLGFEAGQIEHAAAMLDRIRLRQAAAEQRGDRKVLEHRKMVERLRDLERAPDSGATACLGRETRDVGAIENDAAGVGPQQPGDQVEQGRFTGAVRPDHAQRLAGGQRQVDRVCNHDGAEPPRDGMECEHGCLHPVSA
ncbi:hypothetical protein ACVMAJ_001072 [Bradyrhizobium sp. USDA 4448]